LFDQQSKSSPPALLMAGIVMQPVLGAGVRKKTSGMNAGHDGEATDVAIDPKTLETLDGAVKAHYGDLIRAPLPDRFFELLARLKDKERRVPGRSRSAMPPNSFQDELSGGDQEGFQQA
jgi:hypothetical protein